MKFKCTVKAWANRQLVGMTWSAGGWSVVMRLCAGTGHGYNYERSLYAVRLQHSVNIDFTLNLPSIRVRPRVIAIMLVMWLVHRLGKVEDNLDIEWRQMMRDLTGDDEADKLQTIISGADQVRRAFRGLHREV